MKTAHHAPHPLQHLCQEELRAVTIPEIEAAERALLPGCDYRLRCHHPYGAIKVLAFDVSNYSSHMMRQDDDDEDLEPLDLNAENTNSTRGAFNGSPRSVLYDYHPATAEASGSHHNKQGLSTLCERALSVAQSALVYSDVNFLFPPGQVAFAAVAVAFDGYGFGTKLGGGMRDYLAMRFRNKSVQERSNFELQVGKIVAMWEQCPSIDLKRFAPSWHSCQDADDVDDVALEGKQVSELRHVFRTASQLRMQQAAAGIQASSAAASTRESAPVSPLHPYMGYYHPHSYGGGQQHQHAPRHHHLSYAYHQHYRSYYDQYHPESQRQLQQQQGHSATYFVPIHENGGSSNSSNKRCREEDDHQYIHRRVRRHHRRSPSHASVAALYPPSSSHFPHYNSSGSKIARVTPVMMDH